MQKQILRGMLSLSMLVLIAGSIVFTTQTEAVESAASDSEEKSVPLTHMDVLKEYKKRRDARAKQLAQKAAQMVNPNTGVAYFDNPSPLMSPLRSGYCECSCNVTASNSVAPANNSINEEGNSDKRDTSDQVPSKINENKNDSDKSNSQKEEGGSKSIWPLNQFTG